jgi:hypothetical protein
MAKERISQKWNKNVKSGGTMTAPSKDQTSGSKANMPGRTTVLTHERIAERAWLIWRNRGCIPGEDKRNWFEAEKQLKAELGIN